ncbi:MAG: adenine phosphoribosyltransferase [Chloroflexi bacterium]|nr:adenine phosphoribosyltransferase [Chloroflexota bacterium]MBU1662737.1 adenine phosphoribosyltransferase [Chloroflexota bacterium]
MNNYLRLINTRTQGLRYDVTPLFADYQAFSLLIDSFLSYFASTEFHCVAGIDALGFILGTAIALRAEKGFIPIRKGGKLPGKSESVDFVDYTGLRKTLELGTNALMPNTRVLIVDEWVETGAQMQAAIQLVERQGGIVAGIAAINIDDNDVTRSLRKKYKCCSLWRDERDSH